MFAIKRALAWTNAHLDRRDDTIALASFALDIDGLGVARVAKVRVSKAKVRGDVAAVTALEGQTLKTMFGTSSAAVACELLCVDLVDLFVVAALLLASVVERVASMTAEEVELAKGVGPELFRTLSGSLSLGVELDV